MEYTEFAKYYDLFYMKKNYQKEVEFINNLINDEKINAYDLYIGINNTFRDLKKD